MTTPIDRKYVDIDLSVTPDDIPDNPGLIEENEDDLMAAAGAGLMGSFESEFPNLMLPKAERRELAKENWAFQRKTIAKIYSQGQTSACVGFGMAQATETAYTRRFGLEHHVSLSGMFLYRYIGRSLMSGAMISDGMKRMATVGTLPLANDENIPKFDLTWPLLDYRPKPPSGWEGKIQHRVTKWATARGEDEIESALANNFTGIVGRSGHCVPYVGLKVEGRDAFVPYANSWGSRWSDRGMGYDSTRVYRKLTLYVVLEVAVPKYVADSLPDI